MHDFKSFIIKLTIDIIIVWAVLLWIIAAFMGTKAHAGSEENMDRESINYKYCFWWYCGWNQWTWKKYENLLSIGFEKTFAHSIINECKANAQDPVNCIKVGAFIAWAESSMARNCHRNNCVGMNDWAVGYTSIKEWVNAWVMKYNKYWYKQRTPKSFYRDDWIPPVTHYCMGKKKDWVCKEGTKNSWAVFKKLNF